MKTSKTIMRRYLTGLCLVISLVLQSLTVAAQHPLEQADKQYDLFNYAKAIPFYQQAYKTDSGYYVAQHLANSYRLVQDYKNAETWYATITPMYDAKAEDFLRYAQVLQNNSNYTEAKKQFIQYYAHSPQIDQSSLGVWLAACDSAIFWMKNPRPFNLTNERSLNGPTSDWGATKYNNGVVFASDRRREAVKGAFLRLDVDKPVNKDSYLWTGNDYLRLYQAQAGGAASVFPLTGEGNDYHTGPASFTADGNEMYFTLTRIPKDQPKDTTLIKTIKPGIYWSKKTTAGEWSKPVPFAYNDLKYSVGDPFITPDGKTLYFVSDMPGGKGGTDIYYCKKGTGDNWEKPVNLSTVNTAGNQRTPVLYMGALYFSGDDNTGMGGLDIYKAVANGNGFAKPQNMGYPVNSPQDDFAFMPTGPTTGYLSSNRPGGAGSDDIYSYVQNPVPTFAFEGTVYDKQSNQPIANSTIILTNVNGTALIAQTDPAGKFRFTSTQKSDYTLRGENTGYLSDNQTISTLRVASGTTIQKSLYLEKITLDKPVKLYHIYYDFNPLDVPEAAGTELTKLTQLLKNNPAISIEISAHTDSRGNAAENMKLSQDLANDVVKHIINNGGINPTRVKARGYGATQLLNGCKIGVKCSEGEHLVNRRVEYKITVL